MNLRPPGPKNVSGFRISNLQFSGAALQPENCCSFLSGVFNRDAMGALLWVPQVSFPIAVRSLPNDHVGLEAAATLISSSQRREGGASDYGECSRPSWWLQRQSGPAYLQGSRTHFLHIG